MTGGGVMPAQPLLNCIDCRSTGSVSNGYCMICGAPGPRSLRAKEQPDSATLVFGRLRPVRGLWSQAPEDSGAKHQGRTTAAPRSSPMRAG